MEQDAPKGALTTHAMLLMQDAGRYLTKQHSKLLYHPGIGKKLKP